jgi:hypothetical protein
MIVKGIDGWCNEVPQNNLRAPVRDASVAAIPERNM